MKPTQKISLYRAKRRVSAARSTAHSNPRQSNKVPVNRIGQFPTFGHEADVTHRTNDPTTFGEARRQRLEERYEKKIKERQKLRRAEDATKNQEDPTLYETLKVKGERTGREIGRLQRDLDLEEADRLGISLEDDQD